MALVGTQKISFSPLYGPTGSTTYSPTPVTLTRFNQRRTSFDYNNDSDSSSKVRPSILMNTLLFVHSSPCFAVMGKRLWCSFALQLVSN